MKVFISSVSLLLLSHWISNSRFGGIGPYSYSFIKELDRWSPHPDSHITMKSVTRIFFFPLKIFLLSFTHNTVCLLTKVYKLQSEGYCRKQILIWKSGAIWLAALFCFLGVAPCATNGCKFPKYKFRISWSSCLWLRSGVCHVLWCFSKEHCIALNTDFHKQLASPDNTFYSKEKTFPIQGGTSNWPGFS